MVKTCCAPNCRNKSKSPGISFFCFPKSPELRKEWIRRVKKANFHPTRHTVLCSDHFPSDSFLSESVPEFLQLIGLEQRPARRRLKNGAMPSLFRLTSNGWEEGHGEEEDEVVDMRDEEGLEEESEEEGRFVIQMDVAEEDTKLESRFEDLHNPPSHLDHPSHNLSPPSPPSDQQHVNPSPSNHVDEQGDHIHTRNKSKQDNHPSSRPQEGRRTEGLDGDGWKNAGENPEGDPVQKKDQQPDGGNLAGNPDVDSKDDMGKDDSHVHDGRGDSDAETMSCREKGGNKSQKEVIKGEQPLFTIESVRTLSKDSLDEHLSPDRNQVSEDQPPKADLSPSSKDPDSSDSSSAKKRRASRKSPPSRKSSPGSTGEASIPFPVACVSQPTGPLLCRIDPAFCKFQPVFEVPFASSPTFFHKTADSMLADNVKRVANGPSHTESDGKGSGVRRKGTVTQSSQLPFQPAFDPASANSSSQCLLPCCTGKSATSAGKLPQIKQEREDTDSSAVPAARNRDPLMADPKRKPSLPKFSPPGKILYRSTAVSLPSGGHKKDSKPTSSEASIPYRSEPINILRTNLARGAVPYRSEPLRKLPVCLALPAEPPGVDDQVKDKKNGARDRAVSKGVYSRSGRHGDNLGTVNKTAGGGKEEEEEEEGRQGRSGSMSTRSSTSSAMTASKRKASAVGLLPSHQASIPVSVSSPGQDLAAIPTSGVMAGKLSEGALYIRRDHVMADLLDVFKHSAHRVHRASVFRLCHSVDALPPSRYDGTSNVTLFPTVGGGGGQADGMRENWERVDHKRLFSLFWEECMRVYFDGHLQKVPKASRQACSQEVPYLLGKVLRHGLALCGYWPVALAPACAVTVCTGEKCSPQLYRHSLLKTMFQYEVEALRDLESCAREGGSGFQEVRQERRVAVVVEAYGGTQCQVPAVPEEVDAFVAELAAYYLYCQPFWWLREMRRGFLSLTEHTRPDQDYLSAMTEGEVMDMYHTLLPAPHTLLSRLLFQQDDVKASHAQRQRLFLERCLLRLSSEEMVQLVKSWSHADCLLDDSYHVHFTASPTSSSSSSSSASGSLPKVPPFFRPATNTLVLGSMGSSSLEHFEVMFRGLLKVEACEL